MPEGALSTSIAVGGELVKSPCVLARAYELTIIFLGRLHGLVFGDSWDLCLSVYVGKVLMYLNVPASIFMLASCSTFCDGRGWAANSNSFAESLSIRAVSTGP